MFSLLKEKHTLIYKHLESMHLHSPFKPFQVSACFVGNSFKSFQLLQCLFLALALYRPLFVANRPESAKLARVLVEGQRIVQKTCAFSASYISFLYSWHLIFSVMLVQSLSRESTILFIYIYMLSAWPVNLSGLLTRSSKRPGVQISWSTPKCSDLILSIKRDSAHVLRQEPFLKRLLLESK